MLFSTLKRSNSRISLKEAILCSLPTSATSRDGSLLKHLFFPLRTTFSTQTSLVFSRRRPQTRPGCLRSLMIRPFFLLRYERLCSSSSLSLEASCPPFDGYSCCSIDALSVAISLDKESTLARKDAFSCFKLGEKSIIWRRLQKTCSSWPARRWWPSPQQLG